MIISLEEYFNVTKKYERVEYGYAESYRYSVYKSPKLYDYANDKYLPQESIYQPLIVKISSICRLIFDLIFENKINERFVARTSSLTREEKMYLLSKKFSKSDIDFSKSKGYICKGVRIFYLPVESDKLKDDSNIIESNIIYPYEFLMYKSSFYDPTNPDSSLEDPKNLITIFIHDGNLKSISNVCIEFGIDLIQFLLEAELEEKIKVPINREFRNQYIVIPEDLSYCAYSFGTFILEYALIIYMAAIETFEYIQFEDYYYYKTALKDKSAYNADEFNIIFEAAKDILHRKRTMLEFLDSDDAFASAYL